MKRKIKDIQKINEAELASISAGEAVINNAEMARVKVNGIEDSKLMDRDGLEAALKSWLR